MNDFRSVLEDIDWLWNEWWVGQPDRLSAGDLRRASSSLHLLLVQGLLGKAWRAYGFLKEPTLYAPDLVGLSKDAKLQLQLAAGCIAGGGRQNGIDLSFIGAFRMNNPTTGVPAEAEEGFAVGVVSIARVASSESSATDLDGLVRRQWYLSEYLQSPSAVRRGSIITRKEIIEYFRNNAGGSHHDLIDQKERMKTAKHRLIAEIERHVIADVRDGLHFELLSIGQAVATSPDIRRLADVLRSSM